MLELYDKLEKRLAQIRRDNGQSVRRSGRLFYDKVVSDKTNISAEVGIWGAEIAAAGNYDPQPYGPYETWTEEETRVWFAGKGSYLLPHDLHEDPLRGKVGDFITLLARIPSPSSVYKLIPWTWLLNWFSNLGEIVEQAYGHGVGEFTLDYCYLMRTVTHKRFYALANYRRPYLVDYSGQPLVALGDREASCVITKTTKERIAATPFGFNITLGDLSASQLAILTALGLSRQNFI
jgi:hypothetical protein